MGILSAFVVPHPPLIIPDIGRNDLRKIEKTVEAYKEIGRRITLIEPDTVVIASPHSVLYQNYNHISPGKTAKGDFGRFGCPQIELAVNYDYELVRLITDIAKEAGIMAGTEGERDKSLDHGILVPLYFIRDILGKTKVVRVSLSGLSLLDHYHLGEAIDKAVTLSGKRVVFIASGDLSHKLKLTGPYGFAPEGPAFDEKITEILASGAFERLFELDDAFAFKAAECGLRSIAMMAGALDRKAVASELLSYEGPFGVGYAVASFDVTGDDSSRCFGDLETLRLKKEAEKTRSAEGELVRLARSSLEYYAKNRRHLPMPAGLSPELLEEKAGVFVSLKLDGRLRGCIGTVSPTTVSLADEIIQNAVSAGFRDSRFEPVREDELDRIVYSVDVLRPAQPVSSLAELDPKRYGIIVRFKGRSGLLLPNLEGVDTVEEQLRIALRKGNISPEDDYEIKKFEVIRHH
ncbi:MAG: AmmeMemoRadiSam system protein A [Candidatus Izemoplasmatales bacterium]|jgi:AmmeMemoRadiSam system protein A/AmmeMemoRadiSam system protein B